MNKKIKKVSVTSLGTSDYCTFIRIHADLLAVSYVIFDKNLRKVIVKADSPADVTFRSAPAGKVVPFGTMGCDGVKYRIYIVSPDLIAV